MKPYAHWMRVYLRSARMGRLRAAAYAHRLAHLAAVDPSCAMWQRMYDQLIWASNRVTKEKNNASFIYFVVTSDGRLRSEFF